MEQLKEYGINNLYNMTCKVCQSTSKEYFSTKVLGKYDVMYYKCPICQFIQTEEPYWLPESYSNAITKLDIGLIIRNESMAPIVRAVINKWFNPNGRFVDYGGGYGMLVRMMRDRGFDYYRQDIYCPNIYAESFDVSDVPFFKADLLTAFEVFEHLQNPVSEIEKMLALSDNILFSTEVQPSDHVNLDSWWYFIPETGQHVSLYSRQSLQSLADRFGMYYCWNDQNVHLFSRKKISNSIFKVITHPRWGNLYNNIVGDRKSLLPKDFSFIQSQLKGRIS